MPWMCYNTGMAGTLRAQEEIIDRRRAYQRARYAAKKAEQSGFCKVCEQQKPRDDMRFSSRGRIMPHCLACAGSYRCNKCNEVKEAKHFKTNSHDSALTFSDGERIRLRVCYQCDYLPYKPRRDAYLKRLRATPTIEAFIKCNFRQWRAEAKKTGLLFDLTQDYLRQLWEQQKGHCFYSGLPIGLERNGCQWELASLDRKTPGLGYVMNNVVWTTRLINTSKGQRTAEEFIAFCKKVAYNKS